MRAVSVSYLESASALDLPAQAGEYGNGVLGQPDAASLCTTLNSFEPMTEPYLEATEALVLPGIQETNQLTAN